MAPRHLENGKGFAHGAAGRNRHGAGASKEFTALSDLPAGSRGHVAYLRAHGAAQMQKLMSIGVFPGMPVALLQKFPSYIISLGHSQFAIDKELAGAIFVRPAR